MPGLVRLDTADPAALAQGASAALDIVCDGILRGSDFHAP